MSLLLNSLQDATKFPLDVHHSDYKNAAADMLMAATSSEQDPTELRDEQGKTALHHASLMGNSELVALLLNAGADTEAREEENDSTPLHLASSHGKLQVASLLLEKGANIEERDGNGRTPLYLACEGGHLGMVQLLLNEGADINASEAGE